MAAFFVGSGFIGGTVLSLFLRTKEFDAYETVYVLSRNPKTAAALAALSPRVKIVEGTLESFDLLAETTSKSELIIHSATADDPGSVKAILAGLEKRPAGKPAIYVHTSGTGLLRDGGEGLAAGQKLYSDASPDDIDSLPDSAPHRNVDLLIKVAAIDGAALADKAKVAIVAPPLIFGIGSGPSNNTSVQLPKWIGDALKLKKVQVIGKGAAVWNNIHVSTLATAYLRIIADLAAAPKQPDNLYWFAETSEHTWGELGEVLLAALRRKGLVEASLEYITVDEARKSGSVGRGTNSRSRADRLKGLGWKGDAETGEPVPALFDTVDREIDEFLNKSTSKFH